MITESISSASDGKREIGRGAGVGPAVILTGAGILI